jgi:3-isopropylmalate/(R)-2-methylmalate dehydratase small subunit
MKAHGTAIKYGDNIDTDVIIPARYLNTSDPAELARHCMEDLDGSFHARSKSGGIIIGGENFGCGSSREHAPIAIKACGISCVIAKSFARIFYRNSINIGLPILECPAAGDAINDGDEIAVDFGSGEIRDLTTGMSFPASPFPPFIQDIISSGGLMNALKDGKL